MPVQEIAMRLRLISQAASPAMRAGYFPGRQIAAEQKAAPGDTPDDEPDATGLAAVSTVRTELNIETTSPGGLEASRPILLSSPSIGAKASAKALGLRMQDVHEETALADVDYGAWHGLRMSDFSAGMQTRLQAWCIDPAVGPPDGESFEAVRLRIGKWMAWLVSGKTLPYGSAEETDTMRSSGNATHRHDIVAITHAPIIRAAILHALDAPSASFSRLDIAPLSIVELRHGRRGWTWWPAHGLTVDH